MKVSISVSVYLVFVIASVTSDAGVVAMRVVVVAGVLVVTIIAVVVIVKLGAASASKAEYNVR